MKEDEEGGGRNNDEEGGGRRRRRRGSCILTLRPYYCFGFGNSGTRKGPGRGKGGAGFHLCTGLKHVTWHETCERVRGVPKRAGSVVVSRSVRGVPKRRRGARRIERSPAPPGGPGRRGSVPAAASQAGRKVQLAGQEKAVSAVEAARARAGAARQEVLLLVAGVEPQDGLAVRRPSHGGQQETEVGALQAHDQEEHRGRRRRRRPEGPAGVRGGRSRWEEEEGIGGRRRRSRRGIGRGD